MDSAVQAQPVQEVADSLDQQAQEGACSQPLQDKPLPLDQVLVQYLAKTNQVFLDIIAFITPLVSSHLQQPLHHRAVHVGASFYSSEGYMLHKLLAEM